MAVRGSPVVAGLFDRLVHIPKRDAGGWRALPGRIFHGGSVVVDLVGERATRLHEQKRLRCPALRVRRRLRDRVRHVSRKVAILKVLDSGKRKKFESGMVRDVTDDKTDYTLVLDGPMLERWAIHLNKGAAKYDKHNWLKADGEEELARFRESAMRHFVQALRGEVDEDHIAAVFFNLNGMAYVQDRLKEKTRAAGFGPGRPGPVAGLVAGRGASDSIA